MPLLAPQSPPSRPCPTQAAAARERTVPTQTRLGAPGAYIVLRGYILTAPRRRGGRGESARWRAAVAGGQGAGGRGGCGAAAGVGRGGRTPPGAGAQAAFCFPSRQPTQRGAGPPPCPRPCTGCSWNGCIGPCVCVCVRTCVLPCCSPCLWCMWESIHTLGAHACLFTSLCLLSQPLFARERERGITPISPTADSGAARTSPGRSQKMAQCASVSQASTRIVASLTWFVSLGFFHVSFDS